jgi:hypothetical protein
MWRVILIGLMAVLTAGCNQSWRDESAVAARSEGALATPALDPLDRPVEDFVVGRPIHFKNLTVFPVSTREPRMEDRYITLEEGRAAKTVRVVEMGAEQLAAAGSQLNQVGEAAASEAAPNPREAEPRPPSPQPIADEPGSEDVATPQPPPGPSGDQQQVAVNDDPFGGVDPFGNQQLGAANQVNSVMVINNSDKPLYLMPGETILGGSQDRAIGRELVIQPDGKPVPVEVFCVESGRWGLRGEEQTQEFVRNLSLVIAGDAAVAEDLEQAAEAANKGEFIASAGVLSKDVRLAVQGAKDQSKVWDEVAQQNAASKVEIASNAFTANYADPAAAVRLKPYRDRLQAPIAKTENVVGVIVAINGEVDSLDIFESTPLFTKLWPKLLASYALDAATRDDAEDADPPCPRREARAFLVDATSAKVEETETQDGIALVRRASDRVVSFAAGESSSFDSSAGGLGGGGFGGVHAAAFAH